MLDEYQTPKSIGRNEGRGNQRMLREDRRHVLLCENVLKNPTAGCGQTSEGLPGDARPGIRWTHLPLSLSRVRSSEETSRLWPLGPGSAGMVHGERPSIDR